MHFDFDSRPIPLESALDVAESIFRNAPPSAEFLQSLNLQQLQYSSDLLSDVKARGGICLYGAGTLGRQVLSIARQYGLPVKKIVDQRADHEPTVLDGVQVSAPTNLIAGDVVVVCVGSGVSRIVESLTALGVRTIRLDRYFHMLACKDHPARHYIADLADNLPRYYEFGSQFSDSESLDTLIAIVASRLALDEELIYPVSRKGVPQWFDPCFFGKNSHHNFVDGGAFDGDTIESFINATGNEYSSIIGFEPDSCLASTAKSKFLGDHRVRIIPAGLSDSCGTARFIKTSLTNGTLGPLSVDNLVAAESVSITTIDVSVSNPVTYLKLDVEGNEERALLGAQRCLQSDRPKVAVAAYHKASDLYRVFELLSALTTNYRFMLRHYTETSFETVLYAGPG
jgi:FkbM family methyltransferase